MLTSSLLGIELTRTSSAQAGFILVAMGVASLVFMPSLSLSCPCSSRTSEVSVTNPTARSYPYQNPRRYARIRRESQPSALNFGSDLIDFLGCRRLPRNARLQSESLKRLRRERAGVAVAGLPVVSSIPVLGPVMNAVFNPVVLLVLYLAGASRFWSGFNRTTYTNSAPTKLALTAMWPALYVVSKAYRTNFKKAVL